MNSVKQSNMLLDIIDVGKSIFFIRLRKLFIFYDFRKQITCVGADDELTFGSGFI